MGHLAGALTYRGGVTSSNQGPEGPADPRDPGAPSPRGRKVHRRARLVPFLVTGAVLGAIVGALVSRYGPRPETELAFALQARYAPGQELLLIGGIGMVVGLLIAAVVYVIVDSRG